MYVFELVIFSSINLLTVCFFPTSCHSHSSWCEADEQLVKRYLGGSDEYVDVYEAKYIGPGHAKSGK